MNYQLFITKTAERDFRDAADYIEFTLKNPDAASRLLDLAEKKISALADFPKAHPVIDDPILSTWEIRFFAVKNHIVFYTITGDTIYIIRFLYSRRDWISILKQGFSFD